MAIILGFICVALLGIIGWLTSNKTRLEREIAKWRRDYVKLRESQRLDVRRDLRPSAQIIPLRSADLGGKHRPEIVHIPNRGPINENDRPAFPRGI